MTHKSGEQPGGGAEGKRKSQVKAGAKSRGRGGMMRNTMGTGHSSKNMGAHSAMGKNQRTGDGGASDFDTGSPAPPKPV